VLLMSAVHGLFLPALAHAAPLDQTTPPTAPPVAAFVISQANPPPGASVTITNRSRDANGHPLAAALTVDGQAPRSLNADQSIAVTLPTTGTHVLIGISTTDATGTRMSALRDVVYGAPLSGPLVSGDVLVAVDKGEVEVHSADGSLRGVLHTVNPTRPVDPFTFPNANTGMALDSASNLYVTDFDNQTVSKVDSSGHFVSTVGDSWANLGCPESIAFDSSGNAYVGSAPCIDFGLEPAPIRKFDSAWNLIGTFNAQHEARGTDWVDLANDQCTLLYTSEGGLVKRFNACTNTQLEDLTRTQLPNTGSARFPDTAFALRLLPNGSGVLVADSTKIVRLDGAGNLVATFMQSAEHQCTASPCRLSRWRLQRPR